MYKTKNNQKILSWIQANTLRVMRVRKIARETGISASSVLYQLRVQLSQGVLINQGGRYLFSSLISGPLRDVLHLLVRRVANLNKFHIVARLNPKLSRKRIEFLVQRDYKFIR